MDREFTILIVVHETLDGAADHTELVLQEKTGVRHAKTWAVFPNVRYIDSAERQAEKLQQLLVSLGIPADNIDTEFKTFPPMEY